MLRATVQFRRLQARGGALRRHGGLQLVAPWQVAHRRIASSVGGSQAAAGNGVHDDAKGNHGEPSELEEVKARLSNIDSRLNSLEQALTEALSRQPDQNYLLRKHEAGGRDGPVSSAGRQDERRRIEDPSNIMPVQQAGGGEGDQGGSIKGPGEAVTDGLATLQPKIMSFLNSGYLQAVKELRHALMVTEWELSEKQWARRRGVSAFEEWCADKKEDIPYDALTRLYADPTDLDAISDPRLRMMARSKVEQAVVERQIKVHEACTATAKDMSSLVFKGDKSSVLDVLKGILPWPLGKR